MNKPNRIKVAIQGMTYNINTSQPATYVQSLAHELDECATQMMEKSPTLSLNDAMVLCAMNYADAYKHSEEGADRLRTQVQEYLEDAAKARIELEDAKREAASLRKRLEERDRQIKELKEKLNRRPPQPPVPEKPEPARPPELIGQQSLDQLVEGGSQPGEAQGPLAGDKP